MKEFSLSLLSRGCGRLISSKRNPGRHDGRLDVCFTPQDYYIWKSQEPLLHLSNSGRLLVKAESTLPKTYSTRRGPLLLYSQDLVSTESKCGSVAGNRKKRVVQHYSQQVEQQLSTLKELTSAILSYSNNQCSYSRLAPSLFPPLHVPPVPNVRFPNPQPACSTPAQPSPELFVQHNPVWLPAEENTEQLENQPEDKEELDNRSRVRLDVFLQITCTSRSPTPQTEPQPWVHYVALTPEEPEEDKEYSDMCLQQTESSQYTEINHHSTGEELHYPHMNCVYDMADDRDCSIWRNSETLSDKGNYERSMSGNRHRRTGLYLPPVELGNSACYRSCGEKTDGSDGAKHCAQRLPPIAGATARVIQAQNQQDIRPRSEKDTVQSRENLNRLRLPPLVLSPLFPEQKEEMSVKQKGEREKTERSYFKKQTAAGGRRGGRGRLPSEKEPPPAVGVSGCVVGRIGPGRQSSLAFLQNRLPDLQNPFGSRDADRGVVRGLLPLELRDFQNGKSVGSLILGPDGEIIQLSLYDNNSQHPSQVDNGTQQQALQVLSTEGETLPWIIVLQSEDTPRDGAVELNTDALISNVQQHLPKHKGTESHVSVGQFATGERRLRTKLFQDVHGSTETNICPATSRPDTVAVTLKKTKSAEAGTETLTKPKKDGRNNVRITPLREKVGTEEQRGGDAEAEVEEEDEKGQTGHLSPSHRPGQSRKKHHDKEDMFGSEQNISQTDATTEETVDRRRRNIKKKDTEEAAITTGTSGITTAESEGQKTSRISRDGGWPRQKTEDTSQPIRSQKPEERTNRGTTETHDDSAPPSSKKQTRDEREVKRGQVKKNEGHDRGGGAAARQKEVSTGKKRGRRGRLTHKELVVESDDDPVEKGEVEINQELEEEESFLKSPESPSATQKHKTEAKMCEDVETDCLSSNDEHRNIRSVSSLRSSDAASHLHQRNSRGSAASSWGGAMIASATGFSSACGRLSSCSTVMVADEQLMLNPVKPELPRMSQEEAAALRLAQRAERRRQEVERKRREREEEERRQQEREQTEERMKSELEGERRKRAEELRLKKLAEEEQRRRHEEEEQARVRREQAKREMERRSQEERRRQMERLQRMREEEERRRKAELERLQMEEQQRQEEENMKLQEMDESERIEYLRVKEQEEEERRKKEEENKRREEEAALLGAEQARMQAEQLAREVALLHQQLAFKRGLVLEAGGLEKTQGISRPWIYSYFSLLQLLGLTPSQAETTI
ncbi:uncharacterized protein KIAA2012 homolog [Hippoglossus hippoglossus]|uniref:uncharacterized protein KIAA2012 homolog n=1 Tax=Hippoglossus hippoglossus TaxID=8267 RepID=UPI00148D2E93|nr:uncharacterized protein KIAA2012 homolog [Hippoglossus hippoglossus]